MEYTINKLAKMSGVSTRTLRYYDEIKLLKPARVAISGYRFYKQEQVDMLQQILLYKEMGFLLGDIKKLLSAPDFSKEQTFANHLSALLKRRERLDVLILNVKKSLSSLKGEIIMTDSEKFEGFKEKLISENEERYGNEIRTKYGDTIVDKTRSKLKGLTEEQYKNGERLRLEFEKTLKAAFDTQNPAGELAQKACELHREWLSIYYPDYNREYHKCLGEMYVNDERFRANYDKLAAGCTEFLRDAINIYCK